MAVRYRAFPVTVVRTVPLTPHFVRVTLTGAELAEFHAVGLDQRVKIVLPLDGVGFTHIPRERNWFATWRALPSHLRNPVRTYTVRSFRPDARELDIDFVRHGDGGPASRWAERARPGDQLQIVGPCIPDSPDDLDRAAAEFDQGRANRILLAGDETAAPAICAILEALDVRTVGHAFIEVPTRSDELPVDAPSGVEVRWIARDGASHGVRMIDQVHAWASSVVVEAPCIGVAQDIADGDANDGANDEVVWDVPEHSEEQPVYAWIAGEAGSVRALRRHLVSGIGMDRRQVAFMGYWQNGRSES